MPARDRIPRVSDGNRKEKRAEPAGPRRARASRSRPFYGSPDAGRVPLHPRDLARGVPRPATGRCASTRGSARPRESNRRYRYLLEQGQTGLSVAFDLPTQMGYDSDDPVARGEVGKVGVAIATIEDMRDPDRRAAARPRLHLDDDQLDRRRSSSPCSSPSPGSAASRWESLSGTVQNDLLKEYVARGTYIFPPRAVAEAHDGHLRVLRQGGPALEHDLDLGVPHPRGRARRRSRRSPSRSSNAIAYVEAALARGLAIDDFAPRLSFFFNAHSNFFEEVAKFRAARSLWAEIARDRFGAKDPRSLAAALPHADGGLDADGAAAGRQRRARRAPGAVGGARRDAVAPHERRGRGAGAADGGSRRASRCAPSR